MATISGDAKVGGIPTDGLTVVAYQNTAANFPTPPVFNTPVPHPTPDAGPVTTSESTFGGVGQWRLTVPTPLVSYYVATWNPAFPSIIAWEGPYMPEPHTSLQGWSQAVLSSGHTMATTAVAAGSNGAVLPQSTINVTSTTGFNTQGFIMLGGVYGYVSLQYTSKNATQFLGCTGGSGQTLATLNSVDQAYGASSYRRLVFLSLNAIVQANNDFAYAQVISTVGGQIGVVTQGGLNGDSFTVSPQGIYELVPLSWPVDPNGFYAVHIVLNGTGSLTQALWSEVDF